MSLLRCFKLICRFGLLLGASLAPVVSYGESLINANCKLFDMQGNLVFIYPADKCLFFSNGDLLAQDRNGLKLINKNHQVRWKKSGAYHHQIKLSDDQKSIIALASKVHKLFGVKSKFDSVEILSVKNGVLAAELDLSDHLFEFFTDTNFRLIMGDWLAESVDYEIETTHVNSVFEIPENKLQLVNPVFQKGNFLVHIGLSGYFAIFDRKLKKLLWKKTYSKYSNFAHDVSFTAEGEIVSYINSRNSPIKKHTSILYLDPMKDYPDDLVKELVPLVDGQIFEQPVVGGFQQLASGEMIISIFDKKNGYRVGIYNKELSFERAFVVTSGVNSKWGNGFQEAKLVDVGDFLKNQR